MKVVIMAGGKGTRISSVASDIPKPMIKIAGKPVLEHEIECLRKQGFTDIILTVGHLGHVIMDYFGNGNAFGVKIEYYFEKEPLGNAGALLEIKDKLKDDFLLLNGDVIFDVDFQRFVKYHQSKGGMVTLLTHPNNHPYDSSLIITNEDGTVHSWLTKEDERPEFYQNRVNAGIHILSPKILEQEFEGKKIDLDRQMLKPLAGTGKMYTYDSPEYVRDMGTPERYENVCRDFVEGKVQGKNLRKKQKAIFLDRDGTINKFVDFLREPKDFELLSGVAEAIKLINRSGYLAIVVTNQPVIARGEVTYEQLKTIHNKMEVLLGREGAYVDRIYFCPHHPHKGYEGEIPELKIECECRKPKPGMLFKAAEELNIDLKQSWMVGDSMRDIQAGNAADCQTVLISQQNEKYGQSVTCESLKCFVKDILCKL